MLEVYAFDFFEGKIHLKKQKGNSYYMKDMPKTQLISSRNAGHLELYSFLTFLLSLLHLIFFPSFTSCIQWTENSPSIKSESHTPKSTPIRKSTPIKPIVPQQPLFVRSPVLQHQHSSLDFFVRLCHSGFTITLLLIGGCLWSRNA